MTTTLFEKTVLITGAASGIGKACAHAFAQLSASLILVDMNATALKEQAAQLKKTYPNVLVKTIVVNISKRAQVEKKLSGLAIDILVNNAGIGPGSEAFYETQLDNDIATVEVNLLGTIFVTRSILPEMVKRKQGSVIFIGSIAAIEAYNNHATYCATKAGVRALAQSIRRELLGTTIRVSMIHPGKVRTHFSLAKHKGNTKKAAAEYDAFTPLEAEDIASMAAYIATAPDHVQIQEVLMTSVDQATAREVHKRV